METITITAIAKVLEMLGNFALIIVAPVLVVNALKLLKLETLFTTFLVEHKDKHVVIDSRLDKHGEQIDTLRMRT